MSIEALIQQGDFEGALAALDAATLASPDPGQLLTTFNLLVRLEDFDRAMEVMRRVVAMEPSIAAPMEELGLCAEAERTRAARLTDSALSGKRAAVRPPPPFCLPYVKAAVMHAQGSHAEATRAIEEGRAEVPASPGSITWTHGKSARFTAIADSDDMTGPLLPCFEGGSVLDVPYCDLLSIELQPPKTSFDVLWRPARIVMLDGGELFARVPSLYAGSGRHAEPYVRTGQMTVWDRSRGYAVGAGQRDLRVSLESGGLSMVGIHQIARITFDAPDDPEERKRSFLSRVFG